MRLRSPLLLLALSLAALALASGCSTFTSAGQPRLAAASALPPELAGAPANVREAYQFAFANQDTLSKIPCYCGCGSAGHKSNRDCYVKETRADGTVVWDPMGVG